MISSQQKVLSPAQAQAYYDRFGKKQDSQGFYEDPALDDLLAHADFGSASQVVEFGCGTGKFAARLLSEQLPAAASYIGYDVSPIMIGLATARLAPFGERVQLLRTGGEAALPLPPRSVDRIVSNYVLDLLAEAGIRRFLQAAHQVLRPDGRLCLVSLTHGISPVSRLVSGIWSRIFRLRPSLVGGCRPLRLHEFVDAAQWRVDYQQVVTAFAVPSEVLVLSPVAKASSEP